LVRHRQRAEELTHRAQTYARDVSRFELTMRQAYLKPPHDLAADVEPLRARLGEIARELPLLDGESLQVARLALGKGYLAVGDPDAAQPYLQAAWSAGLRDAELEFALGEALAERYHRAIEQAARLEDAADRKAAEARAAAQLRDAALPHLRAGSSAVESPPLVEAMVLADAGQLDEGERIARKLAVEEPWRFEALRLTGDIQWARAQKREGESGQRAARAMYDAAAASYGDALKIAPSEPLSAHGRCLVAERLSQINYYARTLAQPDLDRWIGWCAADPVKQAELLVSHGQALLDRGDEHAAQAKLSEALRLARSVPPTHASLTAQAEATFYQTRALGLGPASRDGLHEAARLCQAAARLGPLPNMCFLATTEYVATADPPDGDQLLAGLMREIERKLGQEPLMRQYHHRHMVRGAMAARAAAHGRPADWRGAIADAEKVAELRPEMDLGWHNAGYAAVEWAAVEQRLGGDFSEPLATARRDLARGLAIDPQDEDGRLMRAGVELVVAKQALAEGRNIEPDLRNAEAFMAAVPPAMPEARGMHYSLAVLRYLAAPASAIDMPVPADGQNQQSWPAWLKKVRALAARHADVAPTIAQALASIEAGMAEEALRTDGLAYRGLLLLEAARAAPAAQQKFKAQLAVTELERALQVNPRLQHIIGKGLEEARVLAR
jgi:hypothetical protein